MSRASIGVAAFSTVVEWYDFTLYLYLATVLSRVFFGASGTALNTTLGAFAIAYLLRPLGGIVFGHIGDRFGRRRTMLLSVALMTLTMLGTAALPTHAQVGAMAGWLLFTLRCVMGFSVGGEYNAVVAYLLEGAPPTEARLGRVAGVCVQRDRRAPRGRNLPADRQFDERRKLNSWGWRIPFIVGAVLAASVGIARTTMEESPDFERQKASGTVPTRPLLDALTKNRLGILRAFAISGLGSITYYVGITYVPAFLVSTGKLGEDASLRLSTAAAVAVILVTPFAGILSDRIGRKPVLIGLAACSAILPITLFSFMARGTTSYALLGALALACIAGAVSAVGAITTAEQFPGEGRISGLALGATTATAIFGGLTPYVAQVLTERTGWALVPGAMIAVVAVLVLPILITLPETAPRQIIGPRTSSAHIDAAGHIDPLPRHEPRLVRTEEHHDVRDVLRLFEPPERRLRHIIVDDLLRRHVAQPQLPFDLARLHAGLDEAGTHGVDANAVRREFARERLSPAEHREFRGRIMREQRRADLGGERSRVDDAARALGDEMPGGDLVGQEYAARVDGEIEVPILVRQFERALHGRDAGVGDADIAAAELLERFAERALDRRALAHVDLNRDRACANLQRRSPGRLAIDIGDRHSHAALRERRGDGAADPLRAAGYERTFAAEFRIRRMVCRHCPSRVRGRVLSTKSEAAKALCV